MTFKRFLVAGIVVCTLFAGCGDSDKESSDTTKPPDTTTTTAGGSDATTTTAGAGGGSGAKTVDIKGFAFSPKELKVTKGTKVTWTNQDSTDHTATTDEGDPFDSGDLGKGKSFSYTFNDAGTVEYFCDIHNYMKGTVEVS